MQYVKRAYDRQIVGLSMIIVMLTVLLFVVEVKHAARIVQQVEVVEPTEVVATAKYVEPVGPIDPTKKEVYFTNYYRGDGTSSSRTGSGLRVSDFQVNDKGWYLYQGKVVCAAATNEGLKSNYGVLANYNQPEESITYYSYYDEITAEIDGVEYELIVLDTCGASHDVAYLNRVDNGMNRIDIFVSDKSFSFGKKKGYVYENIKE